MKTPLSLFTEHPATVGETYLQHLVSAAGFSLRMLVAGIACLIHALLPFLFERVGSSTVTTLHERMVLKRARSAAALPGATGPGATGPAATGPTATGGAPSFRPNSKALPTP